jgi:hypothetical protein
MKIIFFNDYRSLKGELQRFQRLLSPLLEQLMDSNAPKNITIDKDNNLCINGVSIGAWDSLSRFAVVDDMLVYYHNSTERHIHFGFKGIQRCDKILFIQEKTKAGFYKNIYEFSKKDKED